LSNAWLIFRKTTALSAGLRRGQQDVGHEGVATGSGVPSLRSLWISALRISR